MFKINSILLSSNRKIINIYLGNREISSKLICKNEFNQMSFNVIIKGKSVQRFNYINIDCKRSSYSLSYVNSGVCSIALNSYLKGDNDSIYGTIVSKSRTEYRKHSNFNHRQSFPFGKSLIGSHVNKTDIRGERYVSTNVPTKLKSSLKSESQLKLAQIQTKSPINSFPLLKEENFDLTEFSDEFKDLLQLMKICDENNLNNLMYYPSVSTVLNTTMSPQSMIALDKWKKLKISQLGDEGFKSYQKGLLNRGKSLHMNIKNFIQTKDSSSVTITENIENLWKSLEHVFEYISDVKLCETPISHPYLYYKGIVDCVAHYNGKLVIIEWKTSEKLKPTLNHIYDNPLQAVAYLGAINFEANHCLRANEIVLIYAYEDGSNAQIHHLNSDQCQKYWKQWLTRLKSYWDVIAFKQSFS